MFETWKHISGKYTDKPHYEVSSEGRVYNKQKQRMIDGSEFRGYVRITLAKEGKTKSYLLHDVVAHHFIGDRPSGNHIDHVNGKRNDNRVQNLRYCTPKENIGFSKQAGRTAKGINSGSGKLTDEQVIKIRAHKLQSVIDFKPTWEVQDLMAELDVSRSQIQKAARGDNYKHIPIDERITSRENAIKYYIEQTAIRCAEIAKQFNPHPEHEWLAGGIAEAIRKEFWR